MVHYLYRCPGRHETTARAPIGDAPAQLSCACGLDASRVLTAPMLPTTSRAHRRAAEAAEASTENPTVVSQPPPARQAAPRHTDPRHLRLPKP